MKKALWIFAGLAGIVIAMVIIVIVAGFVQYVRNDHPISLPPPRGPHPVGRVLADWTDSARNRELMVFIWYPARDGMTGNHPEYVPGKWGELVARGVFPIPEKRLREIHVYAIESAAVADGALPVLVMLPGMGRIPADYTVLAEDLASFGYLVAGVTPTGSARPAVVFSDGRVVDGVELSTPDSAAAQRLDDMWAADASFALDQLERDKRFAGHIDDSRIGIFGHSFGGNVAARVPHSDARFLRSANLDGAFFGESVPRVDRPLLILCAENCGGIDLNVCTQNADHCEVRKFPNVRHMNFSDSSALPSRFPIPKSLQLLGDVDGLTFLREVSDRLRAFFAAR